MRYPENLKTSEVNERREKIYVNGIDVSILVSRELYFDHNGRPITVSLKDHTKEIIKGKFTSLDDFLTRWNNTERKEAIIKELQEQGVLVEVLMDRLFLFMQIVFLLLRPFYLFKGLVLLLFKLF